MGVSLIVAVAENGVIGRGGALPWHLSDDLRRFKQLTMGHTIIMGRRTWESIGRPLTGRRMVVVSRQPDYLTGVEGVHTTTNLADAIAVAEQAGDDEAFIIGGASVYREALPLADRLYITRVHGHIDGDTYFPEYDEKGWRLVESEYNDIDSKNIHPSTFEVYERI